MINLKYINKMSNITTQNNILTSKKTTLEPLGWIKKNYKQVKKLNLDALHC
jgi:hypothetical protein